jgi:hypothetical protein
MHFCAKIAMQPFTDAIAIDGDSIRLAPCDSGREVKSPLIERSCKACGIAEKCCVATSHSVSLGETHHTH